jgi:hypothetical protein
MNGFEKVMTDIEHGFEDVFKDGGKVLGKLPQLIEATEDGVKDTPTIVADVTALVAAASGGPALFGAVVTALEGLGTNVAADITVVTTLTQDAPKLGAYVTSLKTALEKLLTDLGADEKQIAAIFEPAPAAAATA